MPNPNGKIDEFPLGVLPAAYRGQRAKAVLQAFALALALKQLVTGRVRVRKRHLFITSKACKCAIAGKKGRYPAANPKAVVFSGQRCSEIEDVFGSSGITLAIE